MRLHCIHSTAATVNVTITVRIVNMQLNFITHLLPNRSVFSLLWAPCCYFLQQVCHSTTLCYNNNYRKVKCKEHCSTNISATRTAQVHEEKYIVLLVQNIRHGMIHVDICSGFLMSLSPFFSILRMCRYCSHDTLLY